MGSVVAQAESGLGTVTVAASGIGPETARASKAAGYRVFGTSRKVDRDKEGGITILPCDLTSEVSVAGVVEAVSWRTGRIDLLVNNAGFGISGGAEESSIEQAKTLFDVNLFDVNLFGVIRMTHAVPPLMRAGGGGRGRGRGRQGGEVGDRGDAEGPLHRRQNGPASQPAAPLRAGERLRQER